MTIFAGLLTAAVAIDPGGYIGRYYIDNHNNGPFFQQTNPDLSEGDHFIDLGAFGANTGFGFHVDASGNVTGITPSVAATAVGASLTFANANVTVDPNGLTGAYFITPYTHDPFTDLHTFVLVPGIEYVVDDGAFIGGSAFGFTVLDATGQVVAVTSAAATGVGSTLQLNPVAFTIDPGGYTGDYGVSPFGETLFHGLNHFALMPLLAYALDDSAFVGGSGFPFQVPAGGGTLRLPNVVITVDPLGGYAGNYAISTNGPFSGISPVVVITGLVTNLRIGDAAAYFTPTATGRTPAQVTVSGVTFALSLASPGQLLSTLLASGQVANAGVAQSLSNAFVHAATLADYQKLQAKIDHQLTLGLITQTAHDALTAEINALIAGL